MNAMIQNTPTKPVAWWEAFRRQHPEYVAADPTLFEQLEFEAQADHIFCASRSVIPGLLQTERYALAILARLEADAKTDSEVMPLRMLRQRHLLSGDKGPALTALIDESVLLQINGDASLQQEQLLHLIQMSRHPRITLRIYPLAAGIDWSMAHGEIASYIYVCGDNMFLGKENLFAQHEGFGPSSTTTMLFWRQYQRLQKRCLSVEHSRKHLGKLVDALASGEPMPIITL